MATFTIALPDGRQVDIQATDQATAIKGAQTWASANPKQEPGFWDRVGSTMSGALSRVQGDLPNLSSDPRVGNPGHGDRLPGDVAALIASPVTGTIDSATTGLAQAAVNAGLTPYGGGHLDANAPGFYVPPHALSGPAAVAHVKGDINTVMMGLGGPEAAPVAAAPKASAMAARVAQFDQAGVTPTLGAVGGDLAANATKFAAEDPLMGGVPQARLRASIAETGQAADRLATSYGTPSSAQATGQLIQRGVQRFAQDANAGAGPAQQTSFRAKAGQLYDQVFSGIPNGPVQPTNAEGVMQDILTRIGAPKVGELLQNNTIKKLSDAMASDTGQISFSDLRNIRTWVRNAQSDPALRQDIPQADLQRLEGALTTDIYDGATQLTNNPTWTRRLQQADRFYAAGMNRINGALASSFDAPTPEAAYNGLVAAAQGGGRADVGRLLAVKRSLQPGEWGDVVATTLKNLGTPPPGTAAVADGGDAFSINSFVTNYNRLSPQGRAILFGPKGGGGAAATGLRAQLDNLAQVADMQKNVERAANASRSAIGVRGIGTVAGLANPTTMLPTIIGLTGVRGLGEVMTNPNFVRWMVRSAKATPAMAPQRITALNALAKTDPRIAAVAPAIAAQLTQQQAPAAQSAPQDAASQ